MKCPNDDTTLQMTSREGIEIDYCPECRGVWLDRGELDKLIERSAAAPAPVPSPQAPASPTYQAASPASYEAHDRTQGDYDERHKRRPNHDYHHDGHYKKKRKESFLGDIFDF